MGLPCGAATPRGGRPLAGTGHSEVAGTSYLDSWKEGDLSGPSTQIQHAHTAPSWGFQTAWSTVNRNQHSIVALLIRLRPAKKVRRI